MDSAADDNTYCLFLPQVPSSAFSICKVLQKKVRMQHGDELCQVSVRYSNVFAGAEIILFYLFNNVSPILTQLPYVCVSG